MITITLTQLLMQNMHLGLHKNFLHHKMEDFMIGIRNDFVIIDVAKSINNFRSGLYCFRKFGKDFYKILFAMTYAINENFIKKVKIAKQYFFRGHWVMGLLSNFFFTRIHLVKQHPSSNYKNKFNIYKKAWDKRNEFFKHTPRRIKVLGFTKFNDFRFLAPKFTKEMRLADKRLRRIKFETSLLKVKLSNLSQFPSGVVFMGFADHSGYVLADARRVFGLTIGIVDSNNPPFGFNYTILGNNSSSFSVEFLGHLILLATLQGKYLKLLELKEVIISKFYARFNIWGFTLGYINFKIKQLLTFANNKDIIKEAFRQPNVFGFTNQFKISIKKILFFNTNLKKKKQFTNFIKFFIYYLRFFEVKLFTLNNKFFKSIKYTYENKILKFNKIWVWWFKHFSIKFSDLNKIFYKLNFKWKKKYRRNIWFFTGGVRKINSNAKASSLKRAQKFVIKATKFIIGPESLLKNPLELLINKNLNLHLERLLYKKIGKLRRKKNFQLLLANKLNKNNKKINKYFKK
jgi:ribosomal protein S2